LWVVFKKLNFVKNEFYSENFLGGSQHQWKEQRDCETEEWAGIQDTSSPEIGVRTGKDQGRQRDGKTELPGGD